MYLVAILFSALVTPQCALATPEIHVGRAESSTITESASLSCPTGDAQSRYEACSSSVSSKIDECEGSDLGCACSPANSGFDCLTSYCPSHTTAICQGSLALNNLCALASVPGPTLADLACPSDLPDLLETLIPSDIRSMISSDGHSHLPSDINNDIPTDVPFFGGPSENGESSGTGTAGGVNRTSRVAESTGVIMNAPSQTGAAAGKMVKRDMDADGLRMILGTGVVISVAVGGLAAFL